MTSSRRHCTIKSHPLEGIRHRGHGMPYPDLGGIRRGTLHVQTFGDFLVQPTSGAKIEWLSQAGLPIHTGNNSGQPRISYTLQRGRGIFYLDMVFHDSVGPEGATQSVGRDSEAVPGSLLPQKRHGWIQRPWMAAALNERSSWPLLAVWSCG